MSLVSRVVMRRRVRVLCNNEHGPRSRGAGLGGVGVRAVEQCEECDGKRRRGLKCYTVLTACRVVVAGMDVRASERASGGETNAGCNCRGHLRT